MGFEIEKKVCVLLGFMVLFPAICTSQFTPSRATYYGSPDFHGTPHGACGFGEFGRTMNDGSVSAASPWLYKSGSGCGACYQVRCKYPQLCNNDGVNVVMTDYGEGDHSADFFLRPRIYAKLALPHVSHELFAFGVVDVEYKRVSCQYAGHNVMYRVHERSKYPNYLALAITHVAGQNDITRVELSRGDYRQWVPMRKAFGAVWDIANLPGGSITLRFQATNSAGNSRWVESTNALPNNWEAGAAYDSKVQLTD